ncbi:MAG TPA: class I SAM-dependent methyltransferase [Aquihabitans sp.]|nr:class I SAM-dependent methyltransferase [Aquihabitans sp.]
MQRTLNTACYLCGATDGSEVFVEDGVALRRCDRCRHVYSTWEQDEHYAGYWDHGVDEADLSFWDDAHRPIHEQFIDRFVPAPTGRLVDVGCGLGFFVAAMARHRPGWRADGYELAEAPVAWAHAHGLAGSVHQGLVEEAGIEPGSVDVITMWDVVEHLTRPQPLLEALRSLLTPDGFLFLQTPSWPFQYAKARATVALDRGVVPGKHYLAAKDHVNQFSRASLTRLAVDCGFQPPTFEVLLPILAVGGQRTRVGELAKLGVYHGTRALWQASRGRVMANPTLFAFLRPEGAVPWR